MSAPISGNFLAAAYAESAEFHYRMANHAPMILVALRRLGATDEKCLHWYEDYRHFNALRPMPPAIALVGEQTWTQNLGDRSRESDYRHFFTREVARLGIDGAVRRYLPTLIPGVAANAMHPLMRLAYGVMEGNKAEVGAALGFWAFAYLPLPGPGAAPTTDDPMDMVTGMYTLDGAHDIAVEYELVWHHIRAAAMLPGFPAVARNLAFTEETPRRMAEIAQALYASTLDFSALHALTGLHWCRIVAGLLDDPAPLYLTFWQAVASLIPKIGFPGILSDTRLAYLRECTAPEWDTIREAAISSPDEHDISVTFSCMEEERHWDDPFYRSVAAARFGYFDMSAAPT